VNINGFQLRHLADLVDGEDEAEITLGVFEEHKASNGERMPAGLYAWFSEYPEEGKLWLAEDEAQRLAEMEREALS
jgi:hypothetical protein